jgi:uncharacterized protein (DUF488 family)
LVIDVPTILTIGHSTHTIEEFIRLLRDHRVEVVVDVRSSPYSKRFPQYSRQDLQSSLKEHGISYLFLGRELGARRSEPECYVAGQAEYERIAKLPSFVEGITRLLKGATEYQITLMCAEHDPLTCHRTILVCRHLKSPDLAIEHILRDGSIEIHEQAEHRLMLEEGENPHQTDIFASENDLDSALRRAYLKRGGRIAYRKGETEDEDSYDRLYKEKR